MQVSQQVLEWQAEAREEGLTEGKIVRARATLIQILEVRFGPSVPTDLANEIAAQGDLAVLDRWFDPAVTALSLDAFRATLHMERSGKDPHSPVS